jgi:hypothetical protein
MELCLRPTVWWIITSLTSAERLKTILPIRVTCGMFEVSDTDLMADMKSDTNVTVPGFGLHSRFYAEVHGALRNGQRRCRKMQRASLSRPCTARSCMATSSRPRRSTERSWGSRVFRDRWPRGLCTSWASAWKSRAACRGSGNLQSRGA